MKGHFSNNNIFIFQVLLKPVDEVLPGDPDEKEVTVTVKHHSSNSEGPKEEKFTLKLKPNSLGEFSFSVPKEVNKLELEVNIILEKIEIYEKRFICSE